MKLYDETEAATFNTREECQKWIQSRVVRFKLSMEHVMLPDGAVGLTQKKKDGRILDTTVDGYKAGELDEPLKDYAKPVRKDTKWLAVMMLGQ